MVMWTIFYLGIVAYETLRGRRPYNIHSSTSVEDVRVLFQFGVDYHPKWKRNTVTLLSKVSLKLKKKYSSGSGFEPKTPYHTK